MKLMELILKLKNRYNLLLSKYDTYICLKQLKLGAESIVGNGFRVFGKISVKVSKDSTVNIGDDVVITSGRDNNPLSPNIKGSIFITHHGTLRVGDYTGMSSPHIWIKQGLHIGQHVNIGADCIIIDNDCHSINHLFRRDLSITDNGYTVDYNDAKSAEITIEDDVLIGARCVILKGVTIGARTIIGAGSVVTRNIPADCIAGGNPCRVIKHLYE